MRLWRVSRYAGLDGSGGLKVSGRWHSAPRAVLYAAEHPALAVLEVLAHLHLDVRDMPTTLRLVRINVADGAACETIVPADLPAGWQTKLGTTRTLGNQWLDANRALLLAVPSALVPESTNYLINARHPRMADDVVLGHDEKFWFDDRLAVKRP